MDPAELRTHFPALDTPWALFDNAGGSAPAADVIRRVGEHLARYPFQLGASYELSRAAGARVEAGRAAAARLAGADADEIVLGPSSTRLVQTLATALLLSFRPGDEIIVTNLDHEANVGPWRALEQHGLRLHEWKLREDSCELLLEDLEPLLSSRTRLVAFTHCSNLIGSLTDVRAITRRVHAAGAWVCVDGVAHAPHRLLDVRAWDVDFYFASFYKLFGPHLAFLYMKRDLLARARGQGHFFQDGQVGPAKLEPGNVNYELVASLPGIVEYLSRLDARCADGEPDPCAPRERLARAFEFITRREAELTTPLLGFLDAHPRVRLLGRSGADDPDRVPTVSFTVEGMAAEELTSRLDALLLAVRHGHFYAYRAVRDLGLLEQGGVVRVSLLHYNTEEEVGRLIEALEHLLSGPPVRSSSPA